MITVGQKIGKWTVLGEVSVMRSHGRTGPRYYRCECECGNESTTRRWVLLNGRSSMCKACSKKGNNYGKGRKGIRNRQRKESGYRNLFNVTDVPGGPYKCIGEHRAVMARRLNRALLKEETVHHKNGIRYDNRDDNLELWSSRHPPGQRVEDKTQWCVEFLRLYAPERLAS